jgi:hypothetical protein
LKTKTCLSILYEEGKWLIGPGPTKGNTGLSVRKKKLKEPLFYLLSCSAKPGQIMVLSDAFLQCFIEFF